MCALGIQSYSQMMIGMSNHLLSIVFRLQYHSQKVIGSLGVCPFYFFRQVSVKIIIVQQVDSLGMQSQTPNVRKDDDWGGSNHQNET